MRVRKISLQVNFLWNLHPKSKKKSTLQWKNSTKLPSRKSWPLNPPLQNDESHPIEPTILPTVSVRGELIRPHREPFPHSNRIDYRPPIWMRGTKVMRVLKVEGQHQVQLTDLISPIQ